jgi:hypothetical protein
MNSFNFVNIKKIQKMGLKKGMTNNPNGRPIGSTNKSIEELRETVQAFIDNNIDTMQQSFDQLQPKEKLFFMDKMLQYCLPKIQNVAISRDEEEHENKMPVFLFR